jgi:hypothetical protein
LLIFVFIKHCGQRANHGHDKRNDGNQLSHLPESLSNLVGVLTQSILCYPAYGKPKIAQGYWPTLQTLEPRGSQAPFQKSSPAQFGGFTKICT